MSLIERTRRIVSRRGAIFALGAGLSVLSYYGFREGVQQNSDATAIMSTYQQYWRAKQIEHLDARLTCAISSLHSERGGGFGSDRYSRPNEALQCFEDPDIEALQIHDLTSTIRLKAREIPSYKIGVYDPEIRKFKAISKDFRNEKQAIMGEIPFNLRLEATLGGLAAGTSMLAELIGLSAMYITIDRASRRSFGL